MRNDGVRLSRPRILTEASRILREEGVRAFWKGNGVTIVHRLPYSSVNFFAYEEYKMVGFPTMTEYINPVAWQLNFLSLVS